MSIQWSRTAARTEAKQRYNERNYDQVKMYIAKGGRDVIQRLAAAAGMSMAEYIRHCIIKEALERGIDVNKALGGGGLRAVTSTTQLPDQLTFV